jgi:hypothetical protein
MGGEGDKERSRDMERKGDKDKSGGFRRRERGGITRKGEVRREDKEKRGG